jgi:drug/metabolite transporter (DMT)-like permease
VALNRPAQGGARWQPYMLLALANLFWGGNWVVGRALRESFDPITLNFWRWFLASLILLPFAWRGLSGKGPVVRKHLGLLFVLTLTGAVLFQSLVYLGLQTTETVNAVLLNSSGPLFMLLCSWLLERERASGSQIAGMLVSISGVLIILSRGDPGNLLHLNFHLGDLWILLAMPTWGVYSVLLKRWPRDFGGTPFLFVFSVASLPILLAGMLIEMLYQPARPVSAGGVAGLLYVAMFAAVGAFFCWNRAVAVLGANVAGFSLPLLPAFGTLLAILFLGEEVRGFHLLGIATILVGVYLATRPGARR